MALFHIQFHSEALRMAAALDVIIPQKSSSLIGMTTNAEEKCKTLYLLHGLSDDQTIWQRRTSIERYAAEKNLAVVMPCGQKAGIPIWCTATRIRPISQRKYPHTADRSSAV